MAVSGSRQLQSQVNPTERSCGGGFNWRYICFHDNSGENPPLTAESYVDNLALYEVLSLGFAYLRCLEKIKKIFSQNGGLMVIYHGTILFAPPIRLFLLGIHASMNGRAGICSESEKLLNTQEAHCRLG